jgi:alanyl-tRNA synthetase
VLRRIMRRGMRHAHLLGATEPVMHRLVPELVRQMGGAYPELIRAQALLSETLKLEETRFKQLLERGLKLLDDETKQLSAEDQLSGDVAFKLYDTYGFPLDLTQDVLRGRGLAVDTDGFNTAMQKQKQAARAAWAGSGETSAARIWFELREELGATEFLGYSTEQAEGIMLALVRDGVKVAAAKTGDKIQLIANQTPFYAESGGQVGDSGTATTANGAIIEILDTQKHVNDLWVHEAQVTQGEIKSGQAVTFTVDHERRSRIRANHSATHLLHEALRQRLGEHVAQKGSLVNAEKLRFDISQPLPIAAEELREIQAEVNRRIRMNTEVETRLMTPTEAVGLGAMALFGEKYGEEVRVVSMGGAGTNQRPAYSVELCGGTHVKRTGDIGSFRIIAESAVAAGVRRIEALTGVGAEAHMMLQDDYLSRAANVLKILPAEIPERMAALLEDRRKLERELSDMRRQLALLGGAAATGAEPALPEMMNGVLFLSRCLHDLPAKDLKPMADQLRQTLPSGIIALLASFEGKVSLVASVSPDLTAKISAVDLARCGAEQVGGKGGGGRPDMAQAGGNDDQAMDKAVAAMKALILEKTNS